MKLSAKKVICLVVAVLLTFGVLTGCGQEAAEAPAAAEAATTTLRGHDVNEAFEIAFIPITTAQENYPIILDGLKQSIAAYPNAELLTFDPQADPNNQISIINDCVTQGVEGIIIQPMDQTALNTAIEEAEEAGVVVYTMNTACSAKCTAHITNSDYKSGYYAAEHLAGIMDKDSKVVILDVEAGLKNSCRQGTGFEDYMKEYGVFDYLENVPVNVVDIDASVQAVRDILTKYDDIDIIYCVSDNCVVGAVQAIEAAGRENDGIVLFGFEGIPAVLDLIKKDKAYATSYSDPYNEAIICGSMMVYLISSGVSAYNVGGFEKTSVIELGTTIATKDNIDTIVKQTHWDLSAYGY